MQFAQFNTSKSYIFGSAYRTFGMQLPERHESVGDSYRYGFQNQEVDSEVKGEGNSVNYKYRIHDPRLGRFFAVDPLFREYPFWSPYAFSGNQVTATIELEGLEAEHTLNENENLQEIEEVKVYAFPYIQGVSGDGIGGTLYNLFGSVFSSDMQAASFAEAIGGNYKSQIKPIVFIPRDSDLGKEIISTLASDHGILFADLSRKQQRSLLSEKWGDRGWFSHGESDRSDLFYYKKSSVVYSNVFGVRTLPVSVPIAVIGPGGIGTKPDQSEVIVDIEALGKSIVNEFAKTAQGGRAAKRAAKRAGTKGDSETKSLKLHNSNTSPSNKNKHQKGKKRKQTDARGGEKGDARRNEPKN